MSMILGLAFVLLALCAVGLIVWGIFKVLPMLGLPEPINTIVTVLLVVAIGLVAIFLIWDAISGGVTFRHLSFLLSGPPYTSLTA